MRRPSPLVLLVLLALARGHSSADVERESDPLDGPLRTFCSDRGCRLQGGVCVKDYQATNCDIIRRDLCGYFRTFYSCVCCINCPTQQCGATGSGTCRPNCATNEVSVANCPGSSSCRCCESCVPDATCSASSGTCSVGPCPAGSVQSSGGCGGGPCICCVPCVLSNACASTIGGTSPGRCVAAPGTCNAGNEYTTADSCGACTCCKTCTPDSTCQNEGGVCSSLASGGCPAGREETPGQGTCNDGNCICCTLTCASTTTCSPGRCVSAQPLCDGPDEYISGDACGTGCFCCQTCTARMPCNNQNGTCFLTCPAGTTQVGSGSGFCDSDGCVCCV